MLGGLRPSTKVFRDLSQLSWGMKIVGVGKYRIKLGQKYRWLPLEKEAYRGNDYDGKVYTGFEFSGRQHETLCCDTSYGENPIPCSTVLGYIHGTAR